jgi:hypothetical protein
VKRDDEGKKEKIEVFFWSAGGKSGAEATWQEAKAKAETWATHARLKGKR